MSLAVPIFELRYLHEPIATFPINRTSFLIGRRRGCHFRIQDGTLSREHAKVTLEKDGTLWVEDLNSTNGTRLNGERIFKSRLKTGDTVTLGRSQLVLKTTSQKELSALKKKNEPELKWSAPHGLYILPETDTVVEFDAVAHALFRDRKETSEENLLNTSSFKVVPRLSVITHTDGEEDEVTKVILSHEQLGVAPEQMIQKQRTTSQLVVTSSAPKKKSKIPWKWVEWTTIPIVFVIALFWGGKYFLNLRIDDEMAKAEKHWAEKLEQAAKQISYIEQASIEPSPLSPEIANNHSPDIWSRVDRQPTFRNFLLFEILDDLLQSPDMKWSLEEALRNLSKVKSVTDRLPSVKKMHVVLNVEDSPFSLEGAIHGRLLFFRDEESSPTSSYQAYRASMNSRLTVVSSCASAREKSSPGKVVLAFSINGKGNISSVFINRMRSSQERSLWTCIEQKLKSIQLDPPPGGSLSVLYAFNFAGSQKLTF